MTTFDMMPPADEGVLHTASYDIARMKKAAKARNAISRSNAYRVLRSKTQIRIDFLQAKPSEEAQIRLRMVYQLATFA